MAVVSSGQRDRRAALREQTATQHRRVDKSLREDAYFNSRPAYARYVAASFTARARLEAGLAEADVIPTSAYLLAPALALDLAALGHETPPMPPPAPPFTPAAAWGTLYVLQGASMGALHLRRCAAELGCAEGSGASHLALQASRAGNWANFLRLLNGQVFTHEEEAACLAAAAAAFTCFEKSFAANV
ncbi:MAG: biliverdin-producing heme oxygenase [Rhodospirillales bacterium]|nr:biliverdin-producing heme oxygenase [Rhodospirillales bacterium]